MAALSDTLVCNQRRTPRENRNDESDCQKKRSEHNEEESGQYPLRDEYCLPQVGLSNARQWI
jgi:hypothetical protein